MKTPKPSPDARKRAEKLRETIRRHDKLYYDQASPEISDYEYDRLYKELKDLEEEYPALKTQDSPTQKLGESTGKHFKTIPHRVPMLSLDNTYSLEELEEFDGRVKKGLGNEKYQYVCELKIDGVSIELVYEKGLLVHAITRGDGEKGDDVLANIRNISGLPMKLKGPASRLGWKSGARFFSPRKISRRLIEKGKRRSSPFRKSPQYGIRHLKTIDPEEAAKKPLHILLYYVFPPANCPSRLRTTVWNG